MREHIMRSLESLDRMSHQFGCDRFSSRTEADDWFNRSKEASLKASQQSGPRRDVPRRGEKSR